MRTIKKKKNRVIGREVSAKQRNAAGGRGRGREGTKEEVGKT